MRHVRAEGGGFKPKLNEAGIELVSWLVTGMLPYVWRIFYSFKPGCFIQAQIVHESI